jgi:hypothetical protein
VSAPPAMFLSLNPHPRLSVSSSLLLSVSSVLVYLSLVVCIPLRLIRLSLTYLWLVAKSLVVYMLELFFPPSSFSWKIVLLLLFLLARVSLIYFLRSAFFLSTVTP